MTGSTVESLRAMGGREPRSDPRRGNFVGAARVPFRDAGEDPEEAATPTRRLSWRDVTSGLTDDSREKDEREEERRLRDLRARAKRARGVVATTPGLAEVLVNDWRKGARYRARLGVTDGAFRHDVAGPQVRRLQDVSDQVRPPCKESDKVRDRRWEVLLGSD